MRAVSARLAQLLLSWLLLRTTRVAAVLVNRTIDDQNGDPIANTHPSYSPVNGWAQGAQCTGCNLHPGIINVSQAFDQTWHDSTYHPDGPDHTITFGFNGTAVYVYHILAGNLSAAIGTTLFTNLTFFLDEQYVGQFVHEPDNTSDIQYNVLVFNQTNLSSDRTHSFRSVTNGPTAALILFDYAIYTTDNDTTTSSSSVPTSSAPATTTSIALAQTSSSHSSTPVGAIVGGTVGGVVVVLAGVGVLVLCLRRRRMVRPPSIAERVEPFTIDGGEPAVANSSPRRVSHPPMLPDLRFGRSRFIPGGGSSTTGSSSAGESQLAVRLLWSCEFVFQVRQDTSLPRIDLVCHLFHPSLSLVGLIALARTPSWSSGSRRLKRRCAHSRLGSNRSLRAAVAAHIVTHPAMAAVRGDGPQIDPERARVCAQSSQTCETRSQSYVPSSSTISTYWLRSTSALHLTIDRSSRESANATCRTIYQ